MTVHGLHYLVLRVGDLRSAEPCHADRFELDVLFREGTMNASSSPLDPLDV